jgi:hypothetical protein
MAVGGVGGAVVLDVEAEAVFNRHGDAGVAGVGVTGDVGQGLGDDPVGGDLHGRW